MKKDVLEKLYTQQNVSIFKTSNGVPNFEPLANVLLPRYTDPLWANVLHRPLEGGTLRKNTYLFKGTTDVERLDELQTIQDTNVGIFVKDCAGLDSIGTLVGYSNSPQRYIPIDQDILAHKILRFEFKLI